jgi:hypothetical protein
MVGLIFLSSNYPHKIGSADTFDYATSAFGLIILFVILKIVATTKVSLEVN